MTPTPTNSMAQTTTTNTTPAVSGSNPPQAAPSGRPPQAHPIDANWAAKDLGLKPIQGPPAPVTPQQDVALKALLKRYMADQVTPDEYQAERAKILGKH
jgi:hypothetical protein